MSTLMTRGERRGLIVLLALLMVVVCVSIYEKGVKSSIRTITPNYIDTVLSVTDDSLNNTVDMVKRRSKRSKKMPKNRQSVPERSPLDEKIPTH